jgi:hypothetical protein
VKIWKKKKKKRALKMDSILPARGTSEKTKRFFCSSARAEKKPLSYFENPSSFAQNLF